MPFGDRTGPLGYGPMSGRGMGFCAGFDVPGYMNPGFGPRRWFGRGRGFGRGFRARWFWRVQPAYTTYGPVNEPITLTKEEEIKLLEEEKKLVEKELQEIKKRIEELKK